MKVLQVKVEKLCDKTETQSDRKQKAKPVNCPKPAMKVN